MKRSVMCGFYECHTDNSVWMYLERQVDGAGLSTCKAPHDYSRACTVVL